MSASESAVVSIGAECGGPNAAFVAELKVPLYRALARHVKSSHCPAIDEYALVLRIDGTLCRFGEEGIARLRFAKARRCITADIQIPQSVWEPLSNTQLQVYLAGKVKAAIEACVLRLKKDRCVIDDIRLMEQVNAAIQEYLGLYSHG